MIIKNHIFILFLLISYSVVGQNIEGRDFKMGIQAGLNSSEITSDSLSTRASWYPLIGVWGSWNFTKNMSGTLGIQYSYRGSKNANFSFFQFRNNYIDFQLIPQFHFGSVFTFEAGIQYAYLIHSEYRWYDPYPPNDLLIRNMKNFNNTLEPILGIKLQLTQNLELAARYTVPFKYVPYKQIQLFLSYDLTSWLNIQKSHHFRSLKKAIRDPQFVRSLKLHRIDTTLLNSEISKFVNLEKLDLSGNHLNRLPKGIYQLQNLEVLDLSNNCLTQIDDSLSNLTELKELNVAINLITNIPEGISKMTKIVKCDFSNNKLTKIPDAIFNLQNLKSLLLLNNPGPIVFTTTLYSAKKLEEIRIDKNAVFPVDIKAQMPQLKILFYNPQYSY